MFNVLKQFRKVFGPSVPAASPRRLSRPTFKPRLEALEERWCPATTDTLALTPPASPDFGIQGNGLYWNPQVVNGQLSKDANLRTNWFDQPLNRNLTATDPWPPGQTNQIFLDGNKSNSPIEFTDPMTVESITVQNGYQNTMTIDDGATVTTWANNTINSSCTLTLVSKDSTGILLDNKNNFTVQSGGTLNLTDALQATAGATFLEGANANSGEYLNNAGTVKWNGTAVAAGNTAIADSIAASVVNTGTFTLNGGTNGNSTAVGGLLNITGYDVNTNNVSFYQTAGSSNLQNGAELAVWYNYYQSGGLLTSDSTAGCEVMAGDTGHGDINIAGGRVVVDNVANSVATLTFNADTLEFNGELDVSGLTQKDGKSTLCDQLNCIGTTVKLGTNSYLNVGTTGSNPLGTGNQWFVMQYASITGSWWKLLYPTGMNVSTGVTKVLVSN